MICHPERSEGSAGVRDLQFAAAGNIDASAHLGWRSASACGKIQPSNKREGIDLSCNSHDLTPHHAVEPGRYHQTVAGTLSVIAKGRTNGASCANAWFRQLTNVWGKLFLPSNLPPQHVHPPKNRKAYAAVDDDRRQEYLPKVRMQIVPLCPIAERIGSPPTG
jgi:hypothetical protein